MGFTKEIALSLAAVAVCACTVSGTPADYRDTSRHVNPATGTICNGASLVLCGMPFARDVFEHPPQEARVQMWYHWIGDCITEEGLVRDFRAMGEAGVGTAHVFAPSMAALPVKAKPLDAEWMRLFAVAIREARKNGMTLGFHNCPGWSSSGGPWILPENSMKMVVSSVADVPVPAGPVFLPQPQTNENYYRDIAAYALPVPIAVPPVSSPFPLLCADEEGRRESSGEMVYEKPFSPRFFSFKSAGGRFVARVRIEAFAEGVWRKIGEREWGPWVNIPGVRTLRLECPVPSRRFRRNAS